jgi:hypothetical protein
MASFEDFDPSTRVPLWDEDLVNMLFAKLADELLEQTDDQIRTRSLATYVRILALKKPNWYLREQKRGPVTVKTFVMYIDVEEQKEKLSKLPCTARDGKGPLLHSSFANGVIQTSSFRHDFLPSDTAPKHSFTYVNTSLCGWLEEALSKYEKDSFNRAAKGLITAHSVGLFDPAESASTSTQGNSDKGTARGPSEDDHDDNNDGGVVDTVAPNQASVYFINF